MKNLPQIADDTDDNVLTEDLTFRPRSSGRQAIKTFASSANLIY